VSPWRVQHGQPQAFPFQHRSCDVAPDNASLLTDELAVACFASPAHAAVGEQDLLPVAAYAKHDQQRNRCRFAVHSNTHHRSAQAPANHVFRVKIALVTRLPIAHESMAGFVGIRMAIGEEERRNKMRIETRLQTYVLNGTEPTELEEMRKRQTRGIS
jgi:hypothetical protein